jgi:hypothetical protein
LTHRPNEGVLVTTTRPPPRDVVLDQAEAARFGADVAALIFDDQRPAPSMSPIDLSRADHDHHEGDRVGGRRPDLPGRHRHRRPRSRRHRQRSRRASCCPPRTGGPPRSSPPRQQPTATPEPAPPADGATSSSQRPLILRPAHRAARRNVSSPSTLGCRSAWERSDLRSPGRRRGLVASGPSRRGLRVVGPERPPQRSWVNVLGW